jgi:hypothetical protein
MTRQRQEFVDMVEQLGLDPLSPGTDEFAFRLYEKKLLTKSNARVLIEGVQEASRKDYDAGVELNAKAGLARESKRVERFGLPEKAPERAQLFTRHVVELAQADESVRNYRKSVWGNPSATLPAGAARRLLASPAVHFLSREELRARGVPMDGSHTSSVRGLPEGGKRVSIRWPGHKRDESFPARHGGLRVWLPGRDEWTFAVQGSFLHELAMRARYVQQIHGWSEQETIAFLIEGAEPAVDSLRVETAFTFDQKQRVTQAWISVRAMPHVTTGGVCERGPERAENGWGSACEGRLNPGI